MFHHYCLHQNHLAEWLNTKKIWVRKTIKLCMKNEIMASERRALQICWPGNHFKVNCGKCGLAPLLGKDVFSIYSTYPFFYCLHSIIQAERAERGDKLEQAHLVWQKNEPLCTFPNMTTTLSWTTANTGTRGKTGIQKLKQQLSHENMVRQNKRSLKWIKFNNLTLQTCKMWHMLK